MIWQYGDYASKGIKEVCEFGYPRTLEQEMRRHVSLFLSFDFQITFIKITFKSHLLTRNEET